MNPLNNAQMILYVNLFSVKHLIFLSLLLVIVTGDNFEDFYEYVLHRMDNIETYERPTNNSYMYSTNNSNVYDGGSYDFIIVGGGSAGTVLASRLSEISQWKVLLIEAGGPKDLFSDIPGVSPFLQVSDMDWGYLTTPQKTCCLGMKNNQCIYPRGRVIGGSSTINGIVYTRGNKANFDKWEELGNPGWSYKDVLPFFKKSEKIDIHTYDIGYHGLNGPLHVNITAPPDATTEYLKKALLEIGVKEVDINGRKQLGMSRMSLNINFNKRCSGYNAFIAPIENKRENLKIVLNAFVSKLLLSKNRANGVIYVKNGRIFRAAVEIELILSAGAINTPQLLMLSGIGPAKSLEKLGIDVKHNLPGVGENLQDHPHFPNFIFRSNITREIANLKEDLRKYLHGKTPLTRGLFTELITFINTTSKLDCDIEILTQIPTKTLPELQVLYNFKENITFELNVTTDFITPLMLLKPKSRGKVSLRSKNPLDFPLIDVRYFSDPDNIDLKTMYKGIKYILKLTNSKSLQKINTTFISSYPECNHLLTKDCEQSGYQNDCDKNYWYCALRTYATTTYHPVGTACMGLDPKYHVVDHNCLVHNFENFRIVDASIMPTIVSAHPNAVVYMIAEKISDHIKKIY